MNPDPAKEEKNKSKPRSYAVWVAGLCMLVGLVVCLRVIPEFWREVSREPNETSSLGNLGHIRSALAIYYGDNEGQYPNEVASLLKDGRYLSNIPKVLTFDHPATNEVTLYPSRSGADTGMWGYVNNPRDRDWGTLFIDCTHTDSKSSNWAAY